MSALLDDLADNLENKETLHKIGTYAVSAIQRQIVKGHYPSNAPVTSKVKKGSAPLRDTQGLLSSIAYKTDNGSVLVGTNHPGAVINNYGGEINAKKSWLFIPASSHTRTLQRRYGAGPAEVCRGLKADGFSIWRQGRALFYREKGRGSSKKTAHMLYILKKSVRIPPRQFMKLSGEDVDTLLEMLK